MYYHFHTEEHTYDDKLKSYQCDFIKKDNTQCKKRVVIGTPYCFIHQKNEFHLQKKESNIENAGVGLFVIDTKKGENDIIFKPNQKICDYDGDVITHDTLNLRYRHYTAPYAIELHNKLYEDASIHRGIGSLINHANDAHANCRLSISRQNKAQIIATKNIRNNTELLCNYGRSYRMNEQGVQSSTNRRKYNP